MNKIANLGIRTLSQTVQPRENQPKDGRKARGEQRRTCKGEKREGHALQRLTTATVRHARNAAAWCWDHVSLRQTLNTLIRSTKLAENGKYNSRLCSLHTQNFLPTTEGRILSS